MKAIDPISGVKARQFRHGAYIANDKRAKDAVINYLKKKGHVIIDTTEDYYFDIESKSNGNMCYSEVEMKNQWSGEWNPTWTEIRIPYRKHRLINKFTDMYPVDTHHKLHFYVLRRDCKFAWCMNWKQLTQDRIKQTYLSNARKYEYFFQIPYKEVELVEL